MNRTCLALIVSACCLAVPSFAGGVPCNFAKATSGWRVYIDQTRRFCFQYPPIYKITRGAGKRHNMILELSAEGGILVWIDQRPFGKSRLEELSRSGNLAEPTKIGELTFYYNGPGGGGVDYSDDFLFNLRGRILHIEFDGPYINDNHPSEETKKLESQLLATFRTF